MADLTVLVVIDSLAPGGAEVSLAAMAPQLIALGVNLHVAYFHERDGVAPALVEAGADLHLVGGDGSRLARVDRVRRLVRQVSPDLVHTTLFEADITGRPAARLAGVPVVSSLVNEMYGSSHFGEAGIGHLKLRAGWAADIATAQLVRRFHAITETVADVMADRLRVHRDLIDVIPRGRNPKLIGARSPERRARVRSELGLDGDAPLLLAVGRHEPQKRIDVLVRAVATLQRRRPDITLAVAGKSGNASADLHRMVAELGLTGRVLFLGHRNDVPDLLCAADVYVMASGREGQSGALIEAMGARTPIVASDLAVFREVTQSDDGSGAILVGSGDSGGFAHAVQSVVDADPAQIREMTDRAYERFLERYTLQSSIDGMLAFYQRSLNRGG